MTATMGKKRVATRTETTSIPTNRFSQESLLDRIVPKQIVLDRDLLRVGCVTLPQREISQSLSKLVATTNISTIGATEAFNSAVNTAQEELFEVNKAAVRVFICFAQADHLSASSMFSSMADEFVKSHCQTAQVLVRDSGPDVPPAFYDPIKFTWAKQVHRVRQAAKRYSERTNADY